MDIEFVVQDTFNLLRPQWKLVLNDLGEASKLFAEGVKQNYQDVASGKLPEPEEAEELEGEGGLSDDIPDGEDGDTAQVKSDSDDQGEDHDEAQADDSDDEEHIVVTRPEDQRDPEADAEFDRELAKMMAESVDSRKTERKTMFDVPLPMRRTVREAAAPAAPAAATQDSGGEAAPVPTPTNGAGTMKFALLSKKGNRQQTRSIDLPSDSNFAIAMRTQQQAEKAEQQRIKNLVLNYDLTDDQQDGELPSFHYISSSRNHGQARLVGTGSLNGRVYVKRQGQSQHSTTSGENNSPQSISPLSDDTTQQ